MGYVYINLHPHHAPPMSPTPPTHSILAVLSGTTYSATSPTSKTQTFGNTPFALAVVHATSVLARATASTDTRVRIQTSTRRDNLGTLEMCRFMLSAAPILSQPLCSLSPVSHPGIACSESSYYTSAANSLPGAYFEMDGATHANSSENPLSASVSHAHAHPT